MNEKTQAIIELVAGVLQLRPQEIAPDALAETVAGWDSLAHLNICLLVEERYGVEMDMETIANATSIPALVALVP
jgi:acyl carrier protein